MILCFILKKLMINRSVISKITTKALNKKEKFGSHSYANREYSNYYISSLSKDLLLPLWIKYLTIIFLL